MYYDRTVQENATYMQKRKEAISSKNDLQSESTEFRAQRHAIKSVQYNTSVIHEAKIRRPEHVENAKRVTNTNWQDEV